jgi:predicted short-subunit dehydrogenase-like oxidoreductase (DUF2520 family)
VFLAVPDDAVLTVAASLAESDARIPEAAAFVHLSGALELSALEPLRARHAVGSFHPLQSFPEPRSPASFRGVVVGVDATTASLQRRLASLARALGARPKRVDDSRRAVYHAAAVFASNYVDALLATAVDLLKGAGWTEREAIAGLLPLTEGTLATVRGRGPVGALTGPVRRGDAKTVERHLAGLTETAGESSSQTVPVADQYRMLGFVALAIAEKAGLEPAAAERVRRALTHQAAATRRRRGR